MFLTHKNIFKRPSKFYFSFYRLVSVLLEFSIVWSLCVIGIIVLISGLSVFILFSETFF